MILHGVKTSKLCHFKIIAPQVVLVMTERWDSPVPVIDVGGVRSLLYNPTGITFSPLGHLDIVEQIPNKRTPFKMHPVKD